MKRLYRCTQCHLWYERDTPRPRTWIRSWCEKSGGYARLYRVSARKANG